MTERTKRISRRTFLLTAGAGSAAAAAAIVAKTNLAPAEAPAPVSGKRATHGYRASEHISNFYRTAKI